MILRPKHTFETIVGDLISGLTTGTITLSEPENTNQRFAPKAPAATSASGVAGHALDAYREGYEAGLNNVRSNLKVLTYRAETTERSFFRRIRKHLVIVVVKSNDIILSVEGDIAEVDAFQDIPAGTKAILKSGSGWPIAQGF